MATKQELINTLYVYDVATLEKLVVIADSMIVPQKEGITSVDFASLVDSVFKSGGFADLYYPEWTDRGKGDFGRFLVELFALFSDKDFFYINHFGREGHGSTAELYRNLLHKAISNNIDVPSNIAATQDFDLVFENGDAVDYDRGSIQIGLDGIIGKTFSNLSAFTLAFDDTEPEPTTVIEFVHGEIEEISGEFNGKSILIDKENIIYNTVELKVDGISYLNVDSFADGDSSTKQFKVFINSVGQAELVFAQADYGFTPNIGDVYEVSLFIGGGSGGNMTSDLLDKVLACPERQILNFTQPATSGGTDLMSTETLRHYLLNKQRNNDRCVTTEDTNAIVEELDFIRRVHSQSVSNYVFLYVVTVSGTPLSGLQETAISDHLTGKVLMGYGVLASNPPSVTITMVADIYALPSADKASIEAQALEIVKDYLMPERNGEFGEGVKRGKLSGLLLSAIGKTQNVVFSELNEGAAPTGTPNDISVEPNEVINYIASSITINVIGGE